MFPHTFRKGVAVAFVATVVGLSGLTACASAKNATPETKTFPFSGGTLNIRSHGVPTDIVATDRTDVRVTRWFDAKWGADKHESWELDGKDLTLKAECEGLANCDVHFKVEVPKSVKVLRDGHDTDLKGIKAAGTPAFTSAQQPAA